MTSYYFTMVFVCYSSNIHVSWLKICSCHEKLFSHHVISFFIFQTFMLTQRCLKSFFSFEVPFAPLPFAAFSLKFYISQDAMEYAECEATVKSYPPFIEAMKRRGVDDMDLVMVDAW